MRLIDEDALKKEIHRYALDVYCINLENSKEFAGYSTAENYCEGLYEATELIDYLPTIDAVPVNELLKLRDWLYESDGITMGGLRSLNELIAKYSSNPLPRIENGFERRNDD